jgi:hypothetical protein
MNQNVHPGSGSRIFTHPGSRGKKGTGSRIRIRNTGHYDKADPPSTALNKKTN